MSRANPALVIVPLLGALITVLSCGGDRSPTAPGGTAVFVIRACLGSEHAPAGETFRIRLTDRGVIDQADGLIGRGSVMIVLGSLAAGDGGFNAPWSWHLDPNTVEFAEGAIELCDACPSLIEADLDYWLNTVGNYCPWSTEVIAREG